MIAKKTAISFTGQRFKVSPDLVQSALTSAGIKDPLIHMRSEGRKVILTLSHHLTKTEKTTLATKFQAARTVVKDA